MRINEMFMLGREVYDWHLLLRCCFFGYFFILILKFFKSFQANPRLDVVVQTINHCSVNVAHFAIVFLAIFLCYAFAGHFLLGHKHKGWSSMLGSVYMCWSTSLSMDMVKEFSVPIQAVCFAWTLSYQVLVQQVMLNMLYCIVFDSYAYVKNRSGTPQTLFAQIRSAAATARETRGFVNLYTLIVQLEDDDFPAHPNEVVTVRSLKRAFERDGMSRLNAEYLMRQTADYAQEKGEDVEITLSDAIRVTGHIQKNTMLKNLVLSEDSLDMITTEARNKEAAEKQQDRAAFVSNTLGEMPQFEKVEGKDSVADETCDALEQHLIHVSTTLQECRQEQANMAADVNAALEEIWKQEDRRYSKVDLLIHDLEQGLQAVEHSIGSMGVSFSGTNFQQLASVPDRCDTPQILEALTSRSASSDSCVERLDLRLSELKEHMHELSEASQTEELRELFWQLELSLRNLNGGKSLGRSHETESVIPMKCFIRGKNAVVNNIQAGTSPPARPLQQVMDFGFDDGLYDWGEAQAEDQAGAEEASLHGDKDDEDTQVFDFDEDDEDAYPPDGDGHQDGGGPPDDGEPTRSRRRSRSTRRRRTSSWIYFGQELFDKLSQAPPRQQRKYRRILSRRVTIKEYLPANKQALRGLDSLTGAAALELEEEVFRKGGIIREYESLTRLQGESVNAYVSVGVRRASKFLNQLMVGSSPAKVPWAVSPSTFMHSSASAAGKELSPAQEELDHAWLVGKYADAEVVCWEGGDLPERYFSYGTVAEKPLRPVGIATSECLYNLLGMGNSGGNRRTQRQALKRELPWKSIPSADWPAFPGVPNFLFWHEAHLYFRDFSLPAFCRDPARDNKVTTMLGIHVDDLIGGAKDVAKQQMAAVEASFERIKRWPHGRITQDQSHYVADMILTKAKAPEGTVGIRPKAAVGKSRDELKIEDLHEVNRSLRYAKATADTSISIEPAPADKRSWWPTGTPICDTGFAFGMEEF
ncbi:unnamed protein product [Effrenium voratum]|nr:unnamed protein product [Effrenium voratum]